MATVTRTAAIVMRGIYEVFLFDAGFTLANRRLGSLHAEARYLRGLPGRSHNLNVNNVNGILTQARPSVKRI